MELYLLVAKPNTTQNRYIDEATLAPMASCTEHGPAARGNQIRYWPHAARK